MQYFPTGSLASKADIHAFNERWYVSHLIAMKERPLYETPEPVRVYRLLYLPTFHQPSVIRLADAGDSWNLVCKRSDGRGGYDPGELAVESRSALSQAEVGEFDELLSKARFWDIPSFDESIIGLDGSQAILEGVFGDRYHVVDRWSPHGTDYAALAGFLLTLCDTDE